MIQFQYFENFSKAGAVFDDLRLWEGIKGEKMKSRVQPIRELYLVGENEKADELKKKLPAVTVSATFNGTRRLENVSSYSQVIVLDLDFKEVQEAELSRLKEIASNCSCTFMVFISPSGRGLKILIKVNSLIDNHKLACKQATQFYSKLMNVTFDEVTNDIPRLMFMSYDPDIYYYPDSEVFNIVVRTNEKKEDAKVVQLPTTIGDEILAEYERAYSYTSRRSKYEEGSRNNFLFLLSSACNKYGIPKTILMEMIPWCDLPSSEIRATVNSGYKNKSEFNTWNVFSKKDSRRNNRYNKAEKIVEQSENSNFSFNNSATNNFAIPIEIKHRLPDLISEFALSYKDERQSDIAFITMLNFLSSVVDNVYGYYEKQIIYPQLYSMVVAEPGSGKSIMNEVSNLFQPLHRHLRYFDTKFCRAHGFYLSPHSSATTLIKQISENNGQGCVFVSDIDFIGSALKGDSSGFYALLKTSFSNEYLSTSKDIKGKAVEIANPRPTFCISGSFEQIKSLVPSSTIGLFSRFLVYRFEEDNVWRDLTSIDTVIWKTFTNKISNKIYQLYNFVQQNSFEFRWTDEQYDAVNQVFSDLLETASFNKGVNMSAVVKQLSVILFKVSMIISTLRAAEEKSTQTILHCTDDDFDAAMHLMRIHYNHSVSLAPYLIEVNNTPADERLKVFYNSLPEEGFDRKTAIDVCERIKLKVSDRTVDNFLKRLVDTHFLQKEYNNYQKVRKDEQSQKAA